MSSAPRTTRQSIPANAGPPGRSVFRAAGRGSYLSTFAAGLAEPARDALQASLRTVLVTRLHENALEYEAPTAPNEIAKLGFFHNSFRVFATSVSAGEHDEIGRALAASINAHELEVAVPKRAKTFRTMTTLGSELVGLSKPVLRNLEDAIRSATGLRPDRGGADIEFWILIRTDGSTFFASRLTSKTELPPLHKGELRPELASLLCEMSEPSPNDSFLDPFCGYGAIPKQRAMRPARAIQASDIDSEKVAILQSQLRQCASQLRAPIDCKVDDARILSRYDAASVDKIVTDPPWGVFDETRPEDIYAPFLQRAQEILTPGGLLVMVAHRSLSVRGYVASCPKLAIEREHEFLLSGQKSTVYRVRRLST
jgi:tRNA (guanine6-N2)-methyltransferase